MIMELIISGIVTEVHEKAYYENDRGLYERQDFVLITTGEYPKHVLFSSYAKRHRGVPVVNVGEEVIVEFWAKSVLLKGKYYTNLQAIKIEPMILKQVTIE